MKVRLMRIRGEGFGGSVHETCIVEIDSTDPLPAGALCLVGDETPVSDWSQEGVPVPDAVEMEKPECQRTT